MASCSALPANKVPADDAGVTVIVIRPIWGGAAYLSRLRFVVSDLHFPSS